MALLFTFREPVRRGPNLEAGPGLGIKEAVAYSVDNNSLFLPLYIGCAVVDCTATALARETLLS